MWAACKLQVLCIIQNKTRTKSRIKNITKRKRDSKKGKGGVSILGGSIRTWKKRRGWGSICNTKCETNGGEVCWLCILVSIGCARYFV